MAAALRIPLSLQILTHAPGRLVVSLLGILLAVVLMFSQVGFRDAMFDSQAEIIQRFRGDLVIVNKLKYIMSAPEPFASRRLYQARAVPGVRAVYPLYIERALSLWKNPIDHRLRPIRALGFNPADPVFDIPEVEASADALRRPNTVLFDETSRDGYGKPHAGTQTELAHQAVTVAGTFTLGTDFMTEGNVIMSDRNFEKFFRGRSSPSPRLDTVEVGVVQLLPRANLDEVQTALRAALPGDVLVLTKAKLVQKERRYWEDHTAIGYVFYLGMGVAIVVGIIICYQILYTNVSNYLPQFATLKAIGFTNAYLIGVVLQQAAFLAVLGFLPALLAARALLWIVGNLTGLVMVFKPDRVVSILALTLVMCLTAGTIAIGRVRTADPAEVFK